MKFYRSIIIVTLFIISSACLFLKPQNGEENKIEEVTEGQVFGPADDASNSIDQILNSPYRIVASIGDGLNEDYDLFLLDINGASAKITNWEGAETSPKVSFDGSKIAFLYGDVLGSHIIEGKYNSDLYLININGMGKIKLPIGEVSKYPKEDITWLNDNRIIVFRNYILTVEEDGALSDISPDNLWAVDSESGKTINLTNDEFADIMDVDNMPGPFTVCFLGSRIGSSYEYDELYSVSIQSVDSYRLNPNEEYGGGNFLECPEEYMGENGIARAYARYNENGQNLSLTAEFYTNSGDSFDNTVISVGEPGEFDYVQQLAMFEYKKLAFISHDYDSEVRKIFVYDFETMVMHEIQQGNLKLNNVYYDIPKWSPDGKYLSYLEFGYENGFENYSNDLFALDTENWEIMNITQNIPHNTIAGFDWVP